MLLVFFSCNDRKHYNIRAKLHLFYLSVACSYPFLAAEVHIQGTLLSFTIVKYNLA